MEITSDKGLVMAPRTETRDPSGYGTLTFRPNASPDCAELLRAFPLALAPGWRHAYRWEDGKLIVGPEPIPEAPSEARVEVNPPAPVENYADRSDDDLRTLLVERGKPAKRHANRAELIAALVASAKQAT